ncbi:MAG: L-histidine N(alpha)-methyltransferase [Verrucomicrobia bacterium]|nr:L-histidine N(alpha)-methyltransferase [Verrucomicrobiota bacterium]
MPAVNVLIHPSQFPDAVRRDLLESLRTRRINHKFHYESVKQTSKWLALHNAHSPARTEPDCAAAYDRVFAETARRLAADPVHVVGLGCGGGQKDTRLLQSLRARGKRVRYTPVDVGVPMVLTACQEASKVVSAGECQPIVCDLLMATDLDQLLDRLPESNWPRIVTFFGMIPNFEPQAIFPRLANLVRAGDHVLFSANLAPGADYAAGVQTVLPQYDNELTRDWLLTFLLDLGVHQDDGQISVWVEDCPDPLPLKRIVAEYRFSKARSLSVDGETFAFQAGEEIRLFFSYRYQPAQVRALLADAGFETIEESLAASREEGIFLCRKAVTTGGCYL